MFRSHFTLTTTMLAVALSFPASSLFAQAPREVKGHLHPLARPENDRGPADAFLALHSVRLAIRRTPAQQAGLDQLLDAQQNPSSPQYHRWLTPEEFADRFGASREDAARLVRWLESNGIAGQVSRARDAIVFTASAGQIEQALHTSIHRYQVNGETHFANSSEPAVPEELAPLVAGFRGLNDFYLKAAHRRSLRPPVKMPTNPGPDFFTTNYPGVNILAPADLATIYNVNGLYNAGVTGAGLTLAVAGESDIDLNDIQEFRKLFGLPNNPPTKRLVPGAQNPGLGSDAEGEADLDVEWAGAMAPNATILFVYSQDAFDSAFDVIDEALAPVLTFSFGACELRIPSSDIAIVSSEAQKGAAEGITWLASSGDAGAAACEDQNGPFSSAITRLNVNVPASVPVITAVGGSEFSQSSSYWGSTHSNLGSAVSYIPEGGWTDEDFLAQNNDPGFASTGGGASWYFAKPSWQVGAGVPNDGARDVPDVSLTASPVVAPYALVSQGNFLPTGGTSASTPSFAGIVLLLNHYLVATGAQKYVGMGNINPQLYALANSVPNVFHDITSGSNIVPCVINSTQDCTNGSMGYSAGPGYDQVTGLGSVNAYNLVLDWPTASNKTPHLVVTTFTASTAAVVGGSLAINVVVANQGQADAGAFETRVYFTTNGAAATANPFYIYCDTTSLAAGASSTCHGSVTLGASVTAGKYLLLAVADGKNQIQQSDPSGGSALASTGPLTVSK